MAQLIKLKRSALAGKVPTTGSLATGEIAINTSDGKLFYKRDDDTVQSFFTTNALITGSLQQSGSDSYFISNVGIGLINPLHPLHVSGFMSSSDSYINEWGSISASLSQINAGANQTLQEVTDNGATTTNGITVGSLATAGAVQASLFRDNDDTNYFINPSGGTSAILAGNVGIGTTLPSYKLDVSGSGNFADNLTATGSLQVGGHATVDNTLTIGIIDNANTDTDKFLVSDNGVVKYRTGAQLLSDIGAAPSTINLQAVTDNGNVTTNDILAAKLSGSSLGIIGDGQITGDLVVGGTVTAQEFHTEFVSASIVYQSGSTKFGDTSDDVHSFSGSLRITGSGAHYFTDGNVGIGSTTPTHKLYVEGDTILAKFVSTASDSYAGVAIYNSGNGYLTFGSAGDTQTSPVLSGSRYIVANEGGLIIRTTDQLDGHIRFVNGFTDENMRITPAGNVGIGTTAPAYKLDVDAGNIRVGAHTFGSGSAANSGSLAIGKGANALYTGSMENTAVGHNALSSNLDKGPNDAFGAYAMIFSTEATYNTALGQAAGYRSQGTQNTFIGQYTGPYYHDVTGGYNTMIGALAGLQMSGSAQHNTGLGPASLYNLSSGISNTAIGPSAGYDLTTGQNNVFIGNSSGRGITTGNHNTIIGAVTGLPATLSNTIIIADGQSNQRIYINSTGNVGIGTTDPGAKLNVNVENAEGTLSLSRGGNNMVSGQGVGSIIFPADYNGTPTNYGKIVSYANALSAVRGSLDFKVKSTSGSLLTGMTLYGTSAGVNVGIGTTSPSDKLDVHGIIALNGVAFISQSGNFGYIGDIDGTDDIANLDINTADGSTRIFLDDGGNVGINTETPTTTLHVSGGLRLETYGEGDKLSNNIVYALGVDSSGNVLEIPQNTGANIDVDTGTEVVDSFGSGSFNAAFTNYVVKEGTNLRAGQLMSVWDGSGNIEYTDVSTNSLGDTSGVLMFASINAGDIEIKTTVNTNNWYVKINTTLL